MSTLNNKQYGLINPKQQKSNQHVFQRPSIFNDDSESDSEMERPTGLKRPLKMQEQIVQNRAIEEDPTVYQYDEIYDDMDKKRKESKLSRTDLERKPKYISRLLLAAEKRKRENERRIERQVQREREAEGEEFKDKESFVTEAYKKKLEEMRELDEQDRREEYLEAIGDVTKQGNLDGFYRHLYEQKIQYNDLKQESSTPKKGKEEKKVIERKYRNRKASSDEEEEKKDSIKEESKIEQHLTSNLDADSDFTIDSSDSENEETTPLKIKEEEKIEDVTETKEQSNKDEDKQNKSLEILVKIDIWKKRTVGKVFDEAIQRYYQRKSLRESG